MYGTIIKELWNVCIPRHDHIFHKYEFMLLIIALFGHLSMEHITGFTLQL